MLQDSIKDPSFSEVNLYGYINEIYEDSSRNVSKSLYRFGRKPEGVKLSILALRIQDLNPTIRFDNEQKLQYQSYRVDKPLSKLYNFTDNAIPKYID